MSAIPLIVQGRVTKCERAPPGESRFHLRGEDGKTYHCFCTYFFPVRETDVVRVQITPFTLPKSKNQGYNLTSPPLGLISMDLSSVIERVYKILRRGAPSLTFEEICDVVAGWITTTHPSPDLYLEECVEAWCLTGIAAVSGLIDERAKTLIRDWYKQCTMRRLYLFGLTNREINAAREQLAYSHYKIYELLLSNPLALPTIKMEKAQEILGRIGSKATDDMMACGYIVRTLYDWLLSGYTSYPLKYMERKHPRIRELQLMLASDFSLVEDQGCLYFQAVHKLELRVVEQVTALKALPEQEVQLSEGEWQRIGADDLSSDQKEAFLQSLSEPISIITGRAGTGKTTLIARLVAYLRYKQIPYLVCSFTGKAVSRVREVLEEKIGKNRAQSNTPGGQGSGDSENNEDLEPFNVSTISRYVFREKLPDSAKLDLPKLAPLFLIIDETSMVTMRLFSQLLESVGTHLPRVIMVGDANQLPPVGWGSLFGPCLKSGIIPVYSLTQTHRFSHEGGKDGIAINSEMVVKYIEACDDDNPWLVAKPKPNITLTKTDNFHLLEPKLSCVKGILKSFYSRVEGAPYQVTVICPYNETVQEINHLAQTLLYPSDSGMQDSKGCVWHVGDRVMMLRNDYEIGIMNGEEGVVFELWHPKEEGIDYTSFRVLSSDGEKEERCAKKDDGTRTKDFLPSVTIKFKGDKKHSFPLNPSMPESEEDEVGDQYIIKERSMRLFTLSYALTIHKAQGSEWPYGVLYIPKRRSDEGSSFLSRNLLYTAMTRARKGLFFAVDPQSLSRILEVGSEKMENLSSRLSESQGEGEDSYDYENEDD